MDWIRLLSRLGERTIQPEPNSERADIYVSRRRALGLFSAVGAARASDAQRALLISVDGLHAIDLQRYVRTHPGSEIGELTSHGTTFTNAHTPSLSDSFPGLLALVTGGSPVSRGLFYDVSYDRALLDPTNTSCSGAPGNTIVFDESIDFYDANNVSQDVINPAALPGKLDSLGRCVPVYPHNAIRSSTIFEVLQASRGRTAWADKHRAYDLVNGPSGHAPRCLA